MLYGSVCSGVEAATLAWHGLGWQPQFFSEIEPFCCRLLKHRFASVPNFGDLTKYTEWPDVKIDLLVGGTPCQAFSVAGLRQGLADPRGNLALVFLGLLDKYRPRWVVWENVPGVLSSSGGRDFGAFLGALAELGYGFCYRVLNAQHFGVPQRRRRVFVVGHFGDWRRAAAVLFERPSVRGDSTTGGSKKAHVARTVTTGTGKRYDADFVVGVTGTIAHTLSSEGADASEDGSGRGTPIVTRQVHETLRVRSGGGGWPDPLRNETLIAQTLSRYAASSGQDLTAELNQLSRDGVRRLTPRECERLQGMPDDWTLIPDAKDAHRYKAIGNSMAVPVMRWIGEGIAAVNLE
jgi:DNA (cytosine-5)-methyltransferase 1